MMRFFNLKTRLVLGYLMLTLACAGAGYFLLQRVVGSVASNEAPPDLRLIESRAKAAFEQQRQVMLGVLTAAAYDRANAAQMAQGDFDSLLLRLTLTTGYEQAWVTDASGRSLFQANAHPLALASEEATRMARTALSTGQAGTVISYANKAVLAVAIRLNEFRGDRALVIATELNDGMVRRLSEVTGIDLMLLKFQPGMPVTPLGSKIDPTIAQPMLESIRAVAGTRLRGTRDLAVREGEIARLSTLHESADGNVYLVFVPAVSPVAAQLGELMRQFAMIGGAMLLVGLVGALMYGRRISSALGDLNHAARQVSNGRFDINVPVRGNDELSRFAESFNLLTQSLKQRESKMFQNAHRDSVTGLPSRPMFENHLVEVVTRARAKNQSMALVMVVVDRIREVNDSLGRKAGDSMLGEVADRIRRSLRGKKDAGENKSFVARLATYEFGIVLDLCNAEAASTIANRLADVLSRRIEFDGQSILPGARIGMAVFPDHGVDPGSLLYSADIAATHASTELSRIAMFDPSFERDRERQLSLLKDLRRALDQHELYIALLPKISLQKAGPLMAEALMRWEHPERGPQNPADFVPFAEKTGFITQLSNWVIDGSLAIAAQWEQRGMPLGISVNISPRDLGSPEFATYVVERLRAHRLRGNCLTLEVTEPTVIDASPIVKQNLDVLWRLGVKIAIDDFGSGFASLDELRSLPLSYIMIDRQYIRGLTADAASKIVVQSAIDIGHSLGVEVVAEGVETEQQLDALRDMGCDQVQGFFVGKPLTNEAFSAWVKNQPGRFTVGGLASQPDAADGQVSQVPGEAVELTLEMPPQSSHHDLADDLGGEEILLDLGPAPAGNDDIELAFDVEPDAGRK